MPDWKGIISAILYGLVGIVALLFFILLNSSIWRNTYYWENPFNPINIINIAIGIFFLIITVIYFLFARQTSTAKPVDWIDLVKNISRGIVGFILTYFSGMILYPVIDMAFRNNGITNGALLIPIAIILLFIIDAWIIFPFTHAITQRFFHITIGPKIRLAAFLIAIYLIFIFFPSTQAMT